MTGERKGGPTIDEIEALLSQDWEESPIEILPDGTAITTSGTLAEIPPVSDLNWSY